MPVCAICMEKKEPSGMQVLPCGHTFCRDCLTHCTTSQLCPAPHCTHIRHVNVVIDEADEDSDEQSQKISFGSRLPSMLQLEERQRCDGRKGGLRCVNAARMTFLDCRHRLCFDCLSSRINVAAASNELPFCPIFRCANRLTKSEITRIAERAPHMQRICAGLIDKVPEDSPEEPPGKEEYILYCSVYQSDSSMKPITYPVACTVLDMVSAMIQVQRLKKNRTAHNIGVYIKGTVGGKPKYDPFDVKSLSKKKICETEIRDRSHFVLDVDNELKTTEKPS